MRALPFVLLPSVAGCAAPLLPGESVIGVDAPAQRWDGAPGERFGAAVAPGWATAAGVPALRALDDAEPADAGVPADWVGVGADHVYASGAGGAWWRDGVRAAIDVPDARWAAGPAGLVIADADGWWMPETDVRVAARGITAVALGDDRVLAAVDGAVRAWGLDGAAQDITLAIGEGGALGEWQGRAWAGSPEDATPDGAGRVCAEDGACIDGLAGDHLGRALGGGYAAGTFNKWIVPARARFVPLEGGVTQAMEDGQEDQPVTVAGDADGVWFGAPWFEQDGLPGGVVYRVDRGGT